MLDFARDTLTRLAYGWNNNWPVWTKDGATLIFGSTRDGADGTFRQAADGSHPADPLVTTGMTGSWSPDGRILVLTVDRQESGSDILIVRPEDGGTRSRCCRAGTTSISPNCPPMAAGSPTHPTSRVAMKSTCSRFRRSGGSGRYPRAAEWSRVGPGKGANWSIRMADRCCRSRSRPPRSSSPASLGSCSRENFFGGDVTSDGERFLMMRSLEAPEIC